jgi:hypothetical protein
MHKVRESNLREVYNDLLNHAYISISETSNRKMTVDERKRLAELNPEVRTYKEKWMDSKSDVDLLDARSRSVNRNIQTVSRGVTILEAEVRAHTREHSVGGKTTRELEEGIRNR